MSQQHQITYYVYLVQKIKISKSTRKVIFKPLVSKFPYIVIKKYHFILIIQKVIISYFFILFFINISSYIRSEFIKNEFIYYLY